MLLLLCEDLIAMIYIWELNPIFVPNKASAASEQKGRDQGGEVQ